MSATIEDHVLMMLGIKRKGKAVDLEHIWERLNRDLEQKLTKKQAQEKLKSIVENGYMNLEKGMYSITDKGQEHLDDRFWKVKDELNPSYVLVYRAKRYYALVAPTILDFLQNRNVSVFRVFTGKRWIQRKHRGKFIEIRNKNELFKWVNLHGIDFIPYIHRIDSDQPDFFVVDVDAGRDVSFDQTKKVTGKIVEVFQDYDVNPALKFSGSRGFQLWIKMQKHPLPKGYEPVVLPGGTKRSRDHFSFYSDLIRFIQSKTQGKLDKPITTSRFGPKKERRNKILLDPSIMKRHGDVRSPYSIHYKTGLVSVPVAPEELRGFKFEDAVIEKVIDRYKKKGKEFKMPEVDIQVFQDDFLTWIQERPLEGQTSIAQF